MNVPELNPRDDESLVAFAERNADEIDKLLLSEGAVLFRGFGIDTVDAFDRVRRHFVPSPTRYVEAATPRKVLGDDVFSSTEFPASEEIALHNENSYAVSWPGKLLFCCLTPPARGGATPLADVRAVLRRLPARVLEPFTSKGWMLVRNYGAGFGLPWQTAFATDDIAEVERYARESDVEIEWLSPERLRTRQVRPVLARHPRLGERVWFNHVRFWHVSTLAEDVREMLLDEFGVDGLPYNTYFGDGSPVPDDVVAQIAQAYEDEKTSFPWQAGDVLVVDNMLTAHGREAYAGERRVVVAMGETRRRDECLA